MADILANPLVGVRQSPSFSSLQSPLEPDPLQTLSGKGYRPANRKTRLNPSTRLSGPPTPPTSIHTATSNSGREADWNVWRNALRAAINADHFPSGQAEDVPQLFLGSRVPLSLNHSDADTIKALRQTSPEFSLQDARKEYSRFSKDTGMLPKLANLVEQARERSRCVNESNRVSAFEHSTRSAMVGRSITTQLPNCTSAAGSPSNSLHPGIIVMDIEPDVDGLRLLSRHRSNTLSTQPPMPSVPSSSSSAQSSPLCVTPELPAVPLPILSQSSPSHRMGSKGDIAFDDSPSTKVDVYSLKSLLAHPNSPSKPLDTTSPRSERTSPPSLPSSAAPSQINNRSAEQGPSYLSRSQRRLARVVVNPSYHDMQSYLYEGGQTSVVSGGVMLGPQVQGKKQGQGLAFTPKGRAQHHRKSQKAQGNRPPKPKDASA
ncbi:hypothetical protein J3R30DRAFT_3399678 [Lentinula aciculospora]|uniref:Uncharacterized protein n=1 Tax=Lentinula aciculospora TaxID=153920 RepID=A0A9W9ATN8_9AGAR|nr:hypothetical protein J3R30DRAFT_3399678 [Lentinula aciculospora]